MSGKWGVHAEKTSICLSAILIIFLKNRKTAICKSLTLMKVLCEIFFCDTNNVGIGIYNASAVQDKAPNKMLSANDDRKDSSDIETCD